MTTSATTKPGIEPGDPDDRADDRPEPAAEPRPAPKQRADAQQNRERILEVALDALTRDADTSLNAIAKASGVGAGTLYRHFPTREHLIVEVYKREVSELVDAAYSPWILSLEPLEALRAWFSRLAQYGMTKTGLGAALTAASTAVGRDPRETHRLMTDALTSLLDRAKASGEIRADIDPEDIWLAVGFLWRMDPQSDWRAQSARLLDILVAGMRA